MRVIGSTAAFLATIVAAAAIGFGVPLGWIWIGSQLQGGSGASSVKFSVAMAILFGIIASYVVLLYLAGFVMARFGGSGERRATSDRPWMRGMTDTRQAPTRQSSMGGIERVFVITTMLVTAAFWLWFAFKAGSPLPNQ